MTRTVQFRPAYDHRPQGGGQHGVQIDFIVSEERGALTFALFTGWSARIIGQPGDHELRVDAGSMHRPIPAAVTIHTIAPTYEGQTQAKDVCPLIPGEPACYMGTTFTAGDHAFAALVHGGDAALWEWMETRLLTEIADIRTN